MKLTGARCRCPKCGEHFNSTGMFDRHRIGSFANHAADRRCLTPDEMRAKGYLTNSAGYWIRESHRRRADSSGDLTAPATTESPKTNACETEARHG